MSTFLTNGPGGGGAENLGVRFWVTLDLLSKVMGAMEWTVLSSLKRSNKPNFNQSSDTWVVVFVLLEKPTIGMSKRCKEESGLSPSDYEPKQISP